MNSEEIHKIFLSCSCISTDTRKILNGSLFVAIKGERFDANTFAAEAIERGASFVIIDNPKYYIDEKTILVDDSLIVLQELAKSHRRYIKIPIIALTGSNGKTTTKELIHVVLSKKYNTRATVGNLNNHIGVPLTVLSFTTETEIGIVEMGANHLKEIAFLCEIAQPNYGYITNFGKAHLEGFGGVEGVIKAKSELYAYLSRHHKSAIVNLEDAIQVERSKGIKIISFGVQKTKADLNISEIKANPLVQVKYNNNVIFSQLIGLYNANNINAAIAIGKYFDVSDVEIKEAIESYIPDNNRSQLVYKNSNEIILDAYNANPSSMAVAIQNFLQLQKEHKIAILGDMFELGAESIGEHKEVVNMLVNDTRTICYFIGKDFFQNKIDKANFRFYMTFDEFSDDFKKLSIKNNMILIKGSRGMALERTLELL